MKKLQILSLLLITIFISSCTFHSGQVVNLNYGQPVSILNQAVGKSSVGYFLGIGGNDATVLLKEAKDDLIRNRPLLADERYVNQNLNISTSYYIIYSVTRFTLTADVISDGNVTIEKRIIDENKLFNLGDSLISNGQTFLGIFIKETEDSKIKVINRKQVYKVMSQDKVYKINGAYKGFKINDEVSFEGEFKGKGKIKAFGTKNLLVISKTGSKYTVKYENIITQTEE